MMPLLSVIIPTNRAGGLDLTFASLEAQTFRDFELVLVDHLHPWRKHVVAKEAIKYDFPVKHVQPWSDPFPDQAYQRAVNTGLLHASGKYAVFTCDYAHLQPNALAKHAAFHMAESRPRALVGTFRLVETPPINPSFPIGTYGAGSIERHRELWTRYERVEHCYKWVAQYISDLNSHQLDPYFWSIFARDFKSSQIPVLKTVHEEPKLLFPPGLCNPNDCHLKNDSFPIQSLIEINGFDEEFDGCHCFQDTEVANRLAHSGVQFHLDPKLTVTITDVHHLMTIRKIYRPEESNLQLWQQKLNGPNPVIYANRAFQIAKLRSHTQQRYA